MFAIARIKKHKVSDLGKVHGHNSRTHFVKHRDPSGHHSMLLGSDKHLSELVAKRLEQANIKKHRKDAVVCVEMLLTASPEYFRPDAPEQWGVYRNDRLKNWVNTCQKFLAEQYGENVVQVALHCDEATPHMHVSIVPIVEKEKTKRRTKKQIEVGAPGIKYKCSTLCAKELFNKDKLVELQTSYAQYCEPLGLRRGIRNSKAQHTLLKKFYGEVSEFNKRAEPLKKAFLATISKIPTPPLLNREKWANKLKYALTTNLPAVANDLHKLAVRYKQKYLSEKKKNAAFAAINTSVVEVLSLRESVENNKVESRKTFENAVKFERENDLLVKQNEQLKSALESSKDEVQKQQKLLDALEQNSSAKDNKTDYRYE